WVVCCSMVSMGWGTSFGSDLWQALTLCLSCCYVTPRVTPFAPTHPVNQGMLDLKRLYWNCRAFRYGKRRGACPYELLGLKLPTSNWWTLLQMDPKELEKKLSALITVSATWATQGKAILHTRLRGSQRP